MKQTIKLPASSLDVEIEPHQNDVRITITADYHGTWRYSALLNRSDARKLGQALLDESSRAADRDDA